jgi:hypothetical protein
MEMFIDTASYRASEEDNAQRTPPHYIHSLNLNMSIDDAIDLTSQHYDTVIQALTSDQRIKITYIAEERLDSMVNRKLAVLQETIALELQEFEIETGIFFL